LNAEES